MNQIDFFPIQPFQNFVVTLHLCLSSTNRLEYHVKKISRSTKEGRIVIHRMESHGDI